MKIDDVCIVVTVFEPEDDFFKYLPVLLIQAGMIVVIDDSGLNYELDEKHNKVFNKDIVYLKNTENIGIASSLNKGIKYAGSKGFEYILTLDDDSILSDCYVEVLFDFLKKMEGVSLVAGIHGYSSDSRPKRKNACITSGSLFRYQDFLQINGFKDEMFIDYVDFDFCLRLKDIGGNIYILPKASFKHQIGEAKMNVSRKFSFLNSYNHAAFRIYYQTRNVIYILKHHIIKHPIYSLYLLRNVILLPIKILIYDTNKFSKLKFYMHGLMDGILSRWGRF